MGWGPQRLVGAPAHAWREFSQPAVVDDRPPPAGQPVVEQHDVGHRSHHQRDGRSGPDDRSRRGILAEHLTKIAVWKLLFLYIHGTLNTHETHRRLERIGVVIGADEVGQLADLAFADAKPIGVK